MNSINQKVPDYSNLLEVIFTATPNPFVLKDENCVYRRVNSAFCQFLGKTEAEIIGKTDYDLFPASDAEEYIEGDQAVMNGGCQKKEIWEVAGEEGKNWLNVIKTPIIETAGECSGVLCSVTDVTQAIEAEKKAKRQFHLVDGLFNISKLIDSHKGIDTPLIEDLMNCIPLEMLTPGSVCTRVIMEDVEYATSNFRESRWCEKHSVVFDGEQIGLIEIFSQQKPFSKDGTRIVKEIITRLSDKLIKNHIEKMKQTEKDLFKTIIEVMGENFWDWNINTGVVQFSSQWKNSLGYDEAEVPDRVEFWERLVHPDDMPRLQETLEKHLSGETEFFECENRLRLKNGEYRWNLDRGKVIEWDADKNPLRMIGTDKDITRFKDAEQVLRDSEERFQDAFFCAADWIWEVDINGKYTFASGKVEELLGYHPDNLIGQAVWTLMPADEAKRVKDIFQQTVLKKEPIVDLKNINLHRNGRKVTLLTNAVPVFDENGNLQGYRGADKDITDIEHIRVQQKEVEEQLQMLAQISPSGIWQTDMEGNNVYVSSRWSEITGISAEKALGGGWSRAIHPDDLQDVKDGWYLAATTKGMDTYRSEFRFITPDQKTVWVLCIATKIPSGKGWVGTITDITDLKTAEAELRNRQASLEKLVAARTTELSLSNSDLIRANRLKDEFLANMSHELRTPLTAVMGMSEALIEKVYGPLNDLQEKSLQTIEESGRYLLDLIDDILDLSKINAGKMQLYPDQVSVKEVCETSLEMISQMAGKKDQNLSLRLDCDTDIITVDPVRLKQILVNLLDNAVKFTQESGKISLGVTILPDDDQVEFTVQDTGIGIAPEEMALQFKPFVQVDGSFTRNHDGAGLGLVLVQKLTELHQGSVSIDSAKGKFTRVTVTLPLDNNSGLRHDKITRIKTAGGIPGTDDADSYSAGARILIVDDNESVVNTMKVYLENKSYDVLVAHDGYEAVHQAVEQVPDLILMDIQMPGMDGLEAMKAIRNWPDDKNCQTESRIQKIPIIALTALAMPGDKEKCIEAGADDYVSKPMRFKGLMEIMTKHLGGPGNKYA